MKPYDNRNLGQHWLRACCLKAPSHYLNQCWLIISEVLWHSPESNFTGNALDICPWYVFENYLSRITAASHRGKWVNREGGREGVHSLFSPNGNMTRRINYGTVEGSAEVHPLFPFPPFIHHEAWLDVWAWMNNYISFNPELYDDLSMP